MEDKYDLIVIGAGPGGLSVSRFTRKLKPEWRILVVRSQEKSVIPCALPYALDGTIKTEDYIKSDEKLLKSIGIDLLVDEVVQIYPSEKNIMTKNGKKFSYGKLVLATGSLPFTPPIKGVELKNVFSVKDHPDILSILEVIGQVRRAVVVGAGFIGLEMVNAFYNRGIDVFLVERERSCLPGSLSEDFSCLVKKELEERGVRLFLGKTLVEIKGEGKVERCVLDDDAVIDADIVVLCVGVRPDVSLAQKTGIGFSKRGITVNEYFETNIKDIYAMGDCIETKSFITGKFLGGWLATNAVVEGRYLALNIVGINKAFPGVINPVITKVFDYSCGTVGFAKDSVQKEGVEFLYSDTQVYSRERAFEGAQLLKLRLIFRKEDLVLIGAEVIGKENVSWIVNALSLAALNRNTAEDLAFIQYCGHPPQIDVPARMPFVLCAVDVLKQAGKL